VISLRHISGSFAIYRFPPQTPVPSRVLASDVCSVTRTPNELSILCQDGLVNAAEGKVEADWSCLGVIGPLPFTMTGVLAGLSAVLADAGISLFAVSTYDTDYLFVKTDTLPTAVRALQNAGYNVSQASSKPIG